MRLRQTHTYVTMEISSAAWEEIAQKMREAGYDHVFMDDGEIDMHGIAVVKYGNGAVADV
jgi:hypothetical protein